MNEERCIKEKEIDRLTRAMFGGNGTDGVQVKLARIETKLCTVIETVNQFNKKMDEVIKAGEKEKGADEEKEKQRLTAQQRTKIWITAIIGASGTIIALLTLILKGG